MEIPAGIKTLQLSTSTLWLQDGILFSKARPDAPEEPSRDMIVKDMEALRTFIGDRKVCIVTESNPKSKPPKKEDRDFIAGEISSITKALALIVTSPVSRMLANLFFSFKPPAYPVKMFSDEHEATEWIRQYV
jgi:hypothetical protein